MIFQDTSSITSVAFSNDEKQIVTSSLDNKAVLWDIDTGKRVQVYDGHDRGSIVTSVAVSQCKIDDMKEVQESECSINESSRERFDRLIDRISNKISL